jgi:hypothetical protein
MDNDQEFDENIESYIEVKIDSNNIYSSSLIQNTIENKIIEFFSIQRNKLGTTIEFQDLVNELYTINGI